MSLHLPVVNAPALDAGLDESILDRIGVATPCDAEWSAMPGDDRVRRCGDCKLDVYDLSAMTRREAAALIHGRSGRLCVRLYRRIDGTILTQDCWERLRAARRCGTVAFVCTLVLLGFGQVWLHLAGLRALCGRSRIDNRPMGEAAVASHVAPPRGLPRPAGPVEPLMGDLAVPEHEMGKMALPAPQAPRHLRPKMGKVALPAPRPKRDETFALGDLAVEELKGELVIDRGTPAAARK